MTAINRMRVMGQGEERKSVSEMKSVWVCHTHIRVRGLGKVPGKNTSHLRREMGYKAGKVL